jgi:hypothetical protein
MTDQTLARIEQHARVERKNRILVGMMGAMAVVASLGATHAASNVIVADEVRAHRFTLLDPGGGIADDWYTDDPNAPNTSRRTLPGYSGWGFHVP